jgi:hypothetical protein
MGKSWRRASEVDGSAVVCGWPWGSILRQSSYFLMAIHDIQFYSFQISGKILPHSFLVSKDGRKLAVGC